GSVVAGNTIGTNAAGDAAIPNDDGVLIQGGSTNNLIGTDADGASDALERNVISGNSHHGVYLNAEGTEGNVVAGNYIGTDAAGNAAVPNGDNGVRIQACADNRIGGTLAAERNVLSGNGFSGVSVYLGATANLVQGNTIGTDASGSGNLGNGWFGVDVINSAVDNVVGGTASGAGNLIAFNDKAGIRVYEYTPAWHSYDNSLRGNAIFSNGELGIDLSPEEGVTSNDSGDGDQGANSLQNFPVLSTAASVGSHIAIAGSLNSSSNTTFELDFYANSSCDVSGYGEGQIYLGSDRVTTDGSGDASFAASLSAAVSEGYHATATATDPTGNTSEFSACVLVTAGHAAYLPLVQKE
ncbi:MAG: Calx-beta domain-containing protein, partial [Anaerolineae bacterium]